MNKETKELNQINNALDKQINPENQEDFTDMICYLRGANISAYHQEVVRQDLTEMVLSAQQRGGNIHSVIGDDYKAFCDNVIDSLPPMSAKSKVINFFDTVCWSLSILGVITLAFAKGTFSAIGNIVAGQFVNLDISVSVGNAISVIIIIGAAFIIVETLMKNSFRVGKWKRGYRLKAFGIGAGVMAAFMLIAWLGRATLFTVNIFIACVVILALYIIHKALGKVQ